MEVGLPRFAARTIEEVTNFREVVRLSTSIQGFARECPPALPAQGAPDPTGSRLRLHTPGRKAAPPARRQDRPKGHRPAAGGAFPMLGMCRWTWGGPQGRAEFAVAPAPPAARPTALPRAGRRWSSGSARVRTACRCPGPASTERTPCCSGSPCHSPQRCSRPTFCGSASPPG